RNPRVVVAATLRAPQLPVQILRRLIGGHVRKPRSRRPCPLGDTRRHVTRPLWAPWRLEYVGTADEQEGCIFCRALERTDEEGLVVHRGRAGFVLLNKFPYASGHLMIAPVRHTGEFGELEDEEVLEVHRLAAGW